MLFLCVLAVFACCVVQQELPMELPCPQQGCHSAEHKRAWGQGRAWAAGQQRHLRRRGEGEGLPQYYYLSVTSMLQYCTAEGPHTVQP